MGFDFKFLSNFFLTLIFLFLGFTTEPIKAQETTINNKQTKNSQVGKFILKYEPSSSTSFEYGGISAMLSNQEIRQLLMKSEIFDNIVSNLNNSGLVMRENVPVLLKECKTANAYWSPSTRSIIVCYENLALDLILFRNLGKYSVEKTAEKSINETIFAFYHELGHALIDVLSLSAVGQEEDTVDEFATIMLFRKYDPSVAAEIVLDSSEFYELLYKTGNNGVAWGEHAPNDKRLFNLVCLVYGSNPQKHERVFIEKFVLVDPNQKPSKEQMARRASRCQREFPQKIASWNKLLLPHYASQNGNRRTQIKTPSNRSPATNSPGVSRQGTHW